MQTTEEVLNFKPSPNALTFKEIMDIISSVRDDCLFKGKPERVDQEVDKVSIPLGWTHSLYMEMVERYWKVYSE